MRTGTVVHRLVRTKPRTLLALLLANADRPVSTDHLVHELWGTVPPRSATANLYTYAGAIRRLLTTDGAGTALVSNSGGYCLRLGGSQLDATRYERLAEDGRTAVRDGEVRRGAELITQAVRLWRGRPLSDIPSTPELDQWADGLQERHRVLLHDWADARLLLGQGEELVWELRAALATDPFSERAYVQLMLALYRAGRVAQALTVYLDARHTLAHELGIDPGQALTEIHAAMLRRDPALLGEQAYRWLMVPVG
jgi:DNA-binding SARP family transcriptional activator